MDALGYCRCSTDEQTESGLGLEYQRQRITAYCAFRELTLVRIYEDAGVSGGKPLASRPAGKELLAEARRTKAIVVASKLDRFFRSVADAANTIAEFGRKNMELVAISEGIDLGTSYGRAMAQMASVFAELERSMIRERTMAALAVKRGRGERISRYSPYGHDFSPDGKLVENPAEQAVITEMRALLAAGKSFKEIAFDLNARAVPSKRGARWSPVTVRGILGRK